MFLFLRMKEISNRNWKLLKALPWLVMLKFKWIPAQQAKEKLLAAFFKGKTESELRKLGEVFCTSYLPEHIRPNAVEKIRWHQQQGHIVALVSASVDIWIEPWARSMKMELIATKLEFDLQQKYTGKIAGINNNHAQKVVHIQQQFPNWEAMKTYAYGDSGGDTAMLEWADQGFFKPFHSG